MYRPHESSGETERSSLIRDLIHRLESPIPDILTLHASLASPLACIGLLPPQFRSLNVEPLPKGTVHVVKHIPSLQRAILQHVVETWEPALAEQKTLALLEQYFCPDAFSFTSSMTGDVTLLAYSSILSLPLNTYSMKLLARLSREYPIDRLHGAVFASSSRILTWEDCVRNVVCVPGKVANALQGAAIIYPELEHASYFNMLAVRCEALIAALSKKSSKENVDSIAYLLTKLVNLGVFPPSRPTVRSQPSFFQATLPSVRSRDEPEYASVWSGVVLALSSTFTRQAILASLFSETATPWSLDISPEVRGKVRSDAIILQRVFGSLDAGESQEVWEGFSAVALGREWSEWHARVFVCWVAGAGSTKINSKALENLLTQAIQMWSSTDHVKHSLLARHRYLTALLVLTVSQFGKSSPQVVNLASSANFIHGIGNYLQHLDTSVRRCGMLVAEVVAHQAGKSLDFRDWDAFPWAGNLRTLILERDFDAEITIEDENIVEAGEEEEDTHVEEIFTAGAESTKKERQPIRPTKATVQDSYDSDDSLTGYASPTSSRSASPTPSELDEIEKDPTLNVGVKKVPRPVYLAQLGDMIRNPGGKNEGDSNQEPDIIEMALNCGEELVRKKAGYGSELEENAVNLVYGFVSLQDSYDLDAFEVKRQGIVNALVACCPKKSAPAIIEEFFKNQYSTSQRYTMLNALALGARELASLSIPTIAATSFPSKMLPGPLHQKYLAAAESPVQRLVEGISRVAISKGADTSADKVPELVRERQLRIRQPAKVTEVSTAQPKKPLLSATRPKTTFADVAAEFFIAPLINRFWVFLRDEQDRELRTSHHQDALYKYKAAGTGLVLHPLVLSHFLATLAVLVHAGHNSPAWLAIIAPEALELAVTLGVRPVSSQPSERGEEDGKEAAVLTGALELAVVVLDGCLELDLGRTLRLEHHTLLMGVNEWATAVFTSLEKGALVEGGGGIQEAKLRSAAAGVLLKVDDISSR